MLGSSQTSSSSDAVATSPSPPTITNLNFSPGAETIVFGVSHEMERRACAFTGNVAFKSAKDYDGTSTYYAHVSTHNNDFLKACGSMACCHPVATVRLVGKIWDDSANPKTLQKLALVQVEPTGLIRLYTSSKEATVVVDMSGVIFFPHAGLQAKSSCMPQCFPMLDKSSDKISPYSCKAGTCISKIKYGCTKLCSPTDPDGVNDGLEKPTLLGESADDTECSCTMVKRIVCEKAKCVGQDQNPDTCYRSSACSQYKSLVSQSKPGDFCAAKCARQLCSF